MRPWLRVRRCCVGLMWCLGILLVTDRFLGVRAQVVCRWVSHLRLWVLVLVGVWMM